MEFLNRDDPNANSLCKITIFVIVSCPANADLHHSFGIKKIFLDSAPERGSVRKFRAAEIRVKQVCVAVEMDHGKRRILGQGPQDGQGRQMIPACCERPNIGGFHIVVERRHARHCLHQIGRIGGDVAKIGTIGHLERAHTSCTVLCPYHRGHIAQLARAVARPGPIGRAAVPWHADQTDFDILDPCVGQRDMRQPHERCQARKTGQIETGNRVKECVGQCAAPVAARYGQKPLRQRL